MLKVLFTYPELLPNEVTLLTNMLPDWDFVHIRKKGWSSTDYQNLIELIPEQYHNKLVLHEHFELTDQFGLAGIALNVSTLSNNKERDDIVSYSAHAVNEIRALTIQPNYVFLSPVFASISKDDYGPNFPDHDQLKKDLATLQNKVIALGGVDDASLPLVRDLGFDGYAMLGNIWEQHLQINEWQ